MYKRCTQNKERKRKKKKKWKRNMKGWKIISPISMYPNGGHESTNHFKARFEWKCSAELWRNGDKKRGWVRISGFFFTRMKIVQNPWLYRYRNVVYANENKSCISETSTARILGGNPLEPRCLRWKMSFQCPLVAQKSMDRRVIRSLYSGKTSFLQSFPHFCSLLLPSLVPSSDARLLRGRIRW